MAQQGLGALGGHVAAEAGAGAFAAGGRGSFLSVKLQAQVIPRPVDDDQEEAGRASSQFLPLMTFRTSKASSSKKAR